MRTISSNAHTSQLPSPELNAYLHKPLEEIDFPFFANAVHHLRSYVDEETSAAVSHLGNNAIDVSGTGGSGIAKFNTSSAVAFVVASCDVKVVKFGNRSITGRSGSMDFLAALGFEKDVTPSNAEQVLSKTNLLFLNAQNCYSSIASIRDERKLIGHPTIFNFAGPLLNPAQPAFRLMGVSNAAMQSLTERFFEMDETIERAITVRSQTGLDELVPGEENVITCFDRISRARHASPLQREGRPRPGILEPVDIVNPSLSARDNAGSFMSIIDGDDTSSFNYNSLVLNAGAAFLACRAAGSIDEGTALAKGLLSKNFVRRKFDQLRSLLK